MRALLFFVIGILTLTAMASAQTPADQAFVERTALSAADDKCGLFTDLERTALESGRLQAGNALLRSGYSHGQLTAIRTEAELYGQARACNDETLMASVGNLKNAFEAFLGTIAMEYPGSTGLWLASRSRWDTWRVVQSIQSENMIAEIGLLAPKDPESEQTEGYSFAIRFPIEEGATPPASARIHIRDTARIKEPWLGNILRYRPGPAPRTLTKSYWAAEREITQEEDKPTDMAIYILPQAALEEMKTLDPREFVEVELIPSPRERGKSVQRLVIEVGDIAAASTFASLPPL